MTSPAQTTRAINGLEDGGSHMGQKRLGQVKIGNIQNPIKNVATKFVVQETGACKGLNDATIFCYLVL